MRSKKCRVCHEPATHVEITTRPASVLRLDGAIERFTENVYVYYCDDHSGM